MPLQTRRGGTSSDGETSAWTSTSSGREPSIAASTALPGALRGLADEARGGVLDLDEPALAHLEDADVVGRAEAVLERPQRAVGALALALELQHAVHEVLEHPRARQRALLRDVADEQHRDVARLRQPRDPVRDLAHLADGARRAGQVGGVQRLDRVDHAHLGPLGVERRQHRVEIGLRERRDLAARRRGGARPAGGSGPRTPRPRRTACACRRPAGCRAPSRSASTCRSPASRRSGPANRARGRRRAPGRAP